MNAQYILKAKDVRGHGLFEYDLNGVLRSFQNLFEGYQERTLQYILKRTLTQDAINALVTTDEWHSAFKLEEYIGDVTFDEAYKKYDFPGDRGRALEVWNKLSRADRWRAYRFIEIYRSRCKARGHSMMLFKTYLNPKAKIWED